MATTLDPSAAHLVDARSLLLLAPGLDPRDLPAVRQHLAEHITRARLSGRVPTWQHAWNALTGASPIRSGTLHFTPLACQGCHGRRYEVRHPARNLARTGHPAICGQCRGTGRGQVAAQPARYAPPPAEAAEAAEAAEDPGTLDTTSGGAL